MTRYLSISLFFLCTLAQAQQPPSWISGQDKSDRYPSDQYYLGLGVALSDPSVDCREMARRIALANLAESIQIRFRSETTLNVLEKDEYISEQFNQNIVSRAEMDLQNIRYEYFNDKNENRCYALAIVNKGELTVFLRTSIEQEQTSVLLNMERLEKFNAGGKTEAALQVALQILPNLAEWGQKLALANACAPDQFSSAWRIKTETEKKLYNFLERVREF